MALINMVDVDFGPVFPRFHPITVHRFLKSLGVSEVLGVSPLLQTANQVARITFKSEAETEEFLNKHGGLSHHDLEERRVQVIIKEPGVQEKYIRIADFPVNVNLDIVKTRLREFGTVLNIRRERYKATQEHDYIECFNGFITARMTLHQAIPSYLMVGDYKVYVRYSGQILTCRVCNQAGHLGAQCPKRKIPLAPNVTENESTGKENEIEKEKKKADYNADFPPLTVARRGRKTAVKEKTVGNEENEMEISRVENNVATGVKELVKTIGCEQGMEEQTEAIQVQTTTGKTENDPKGKNSKGKHQTTETELVYEASSGVEEFEGEKEEDESMDEWLTLKTQLPKALAGEQKSESSVAIRENEITGDEDEMTSDDEKLLPFNHQALNPSHGATKRAKMSPTPKSGKKKRGKKN